MLSPLEGVERALERAGEGLTLANLQDRIGRGDAQLWKNGGALMVTQISPDPMALHFWLAGGRMADVLALREPIEQWARSIGCVEATIEGRSGWMRLLSTHGYTRDGTRLRKAL